MFARLVEWSLDNRVVVLCAWLLVAAVGLLVAVSVLGISIGGPV